MQSTSLSLPAGYDASRTRPAIAATTTTGTASKATAVSSQRGVAASRARAPQAPTTSPKSCTTPHADRAAPSDPSGGRSGRRRPRGDHAGQLVRELHQVEQGETDVYQPTPRAPPPTPARSVTTTTPAPPPAHHNSATPSATAVRVAGRASHRALRSTRASTRASASTRVPPPSPTRNR